MKPQAFLLLNVLLILTTTAHAQRIGVRGGVSFATQRQFFYDNEGIKRNSVTQFHVGLTTELKLSDQLVLHPALLFVRKGVEASWSGLTSIGPSSWTFTDKLSYLTLPVPLVLKLKAGPGKAMLGAGPYAGLLLAGTRTNTGFRRYLGFEATQKFSLGGGGVGKGFYKAFDAGASFQAGYEFAERFFFLATYEVGLINVQASSNDDEYSRNRSLNLGAGMYFN